MRSIPTITKTQIATATWTVRSPREPIGTVFASSAPPPTPATSWWKAAALSASHGFTRLRPTLLFLVALALSMGGLALAVRTIPIGTGYAVWTGVGAALTVTWAMVTGAETFTPLKALLLVGIVGAVIGLKLLPSPSGADDTGPPRLEG